MTSTRAGRGPEVVVVSQLPPPVHGSTVMTRTLVDALQSIGRVARVVDRRFSSSVESVGAPGPRKVLRVPSLALRTVLAARRRPACCIFFLTNRPGSFLVDALLLAILRTAGVKTVLYLHTRGYRDLAARGAVWRRALRAAFRWSSSIVVLGDRLIDDLDGLAPRGRIVVIPNAVDDRGLSAGSGARPSTGATLLFLSNLLPEKGADTFVRLAGRLIARHPDLALRFDIAGAGAADETRRLRDLVRSSGVGDRARLLGRVDAAERDQLLEGADLLVFPSVYRLEAQPLTIIEALAAGVPVVAYDIGGVGDLVDDGVTGALVPVRDEAALEIAVSRLLTDRTVLDDLRESARTRFAERHSLEAYRTAWRGVLEVVEA